MFLSITSQFKDFNFYFNFQNIENTYDSIVLTYESQADEISSEIQLDFALLSVTEIIIERPSLFPLEMYE